MARNTQAELFDTASQLEMFDAPAAPVYRPNLDKVRARLEKILAEARAAKALPWEPTQLSLYRTIFPQMADFLPQDEGCLCRRRNQEQ